MWRKNCPFCSDDYEETQYVIYESRYWYLAHNKYPILGFTNQYIAYPKRHVVLAKDLLSEEFADYKFIEKKVHELYSDDYFTFMRESVSGRSLEHLHYHFVPGKIYYDNIESMLWEQWYKEP